MKKLLFSFLLITALANAQTAIRFTDVEKLGTTVKQLDEKYKPAIGPGGVFTTEEEQQKHVEAYQQFLKNFGAFLKENNFEWEDNITRCFNRIYISPNGKIDYFLYQFKTPITPEKEKEFNRLLNEYIKVTNFGITAPVKFAQCSPVTYLKSE